MIPLFDMHCHLLAGMDDGPRTDAEALEMCRIAWDEGIRCAAATAHQNDHWPAVTPDLIRAGTQRLAGMLRDSGVGLAVFPCAEVMVHPEMESSWREGQLLSVADRKEYLLLEMPHGLFVDLREFVRDFRKLGIRPILAHPERQPELLHEPGWIEDLIRAGCLVQVSSGSVTDPRNREDAKALKDWFKRGIVHLMGSDGHSPRRRRPCMADAYEQITRWAGSSVADRVCSTNGTAIVHGLPLRIPEPEPRRRRWFARFW
jgi:protein-tyrosine phosphatase